MLDTCLLKPRGCSWCMQQTLVRKWCLFYLRFPSSSNHWTIAKRHHHRTPGCLNDELQAELQLRELQREWQSQYPSRLFLIHAVVHTMQQSLQTSVIMRDMWSLCSGPSCCMVRVRGRKSSIIISMPSVSHCRVVCPGWSCATHKYTLWCSNDLLSCLCGQPC